MIKHDLRRYYNQIFADMADVAKCGYYVDATLPIGMTNLCYCNGLCLCFTLFMRCSSSAIVNSDLAFGITVGQNNPALKHLALG